MLDHVCYRVDPVLHLSHGDSVFVKNYQLAVLFVIIAAFSALRYYLNAPVVLEEVGSMQYVQGENEQETGRRDLACMMS